MNIWKRIKKFFKCRCPRCGGRVRSEFLDPHIDKLVYKCDDCGKRYIIM